MAFAGTNAIFQSMTFTQIDLHLEDSPVDAAITTSDFMDRLASKGIMSRPLSPKARALVGDRASATTPARVALMTAVGPPDWMTSKLPELATVRIHLMMISSCAILMANQ